MKETDEESFGKIMVVLAKAYDKSTDAALTELYFISLREFPIENIERAAQELLKTCKFFPKIAEFVELLKDKTADKELAGAAWNKMLKLIASQGAPSKAEKETPEIACITYTLQRCGYTWGTFGETSECEIPFIRNRFIEAYRSPETEMRLSLTSGQSKIPGIEGLVKKLCGGESQS